MDIIVGEIPLEDRVSVPQTSPKKHTADSPIQHLALASRFNIDSPNKEEEGKLMEIWDYGRNQSKTGEIQDVIWQVVQTEQNLGAPMLGESRLDKVYRFTKLKRQEAMIQEELKNVSLG